MKHPFATAAFLLTLTPAIAFAHGCPGLMAEIDAALPEAEVSDEVRGQVETLRAEGEDLHNAGDHDESMAALEQAKELLGI